jgi:L-histidine N-alpha-methyltransferase
MSIADDVRDGLSGHPKTLPPHLFYDEAGSRLYERITKLPEYYLTRAEHEIFVARAPEIVARVSREVGRPLSVVELGAGSASKTEVLLRAVLERQTRCLYLPVDISATALAEAERRLRARLPRAAVRPLTMTYEQSIRVLAAVPSPRLFVFIGSSVGNLPDGDASKLLARIPERLRGDTWLLLGTDLRKNPRVLHAAYDDGTGVTAAFNKNLLVRINRELDGDFDLGRFRHVARWNDAASSVEMHLESTVAQDVTLRRITLRLHFAAGETIHTESSTKYDVPRVERLLTAGHFRLEQTFYDEERRFALHLARARFAAGRETAAGRTADGEGHARADVPAE